MALREYRGSILASFPDLEAADQAASDLRETQAGTASPPRARGLAALDAVAGYARELARPYDLDQNRSPEPPDACKGGVYSP